MFYELKNDLLKILMQIDFNSKLLNVSWRHSVIVDQFTAIKSLNLNRKYHGSLQNSENQSTGGTSFSEDQEMMLYS